MSLGLLSKDFIQVLVLFIKCLSGTHFLKTLSRPYHLPLLTILRFSYNSFSLTVNIMTELIRENIQLFQEKQ